MRRTILVTGMSGLIGGLVGRALRQRHEIRALNRRPVEGVPCFLADLADRRAIQPAFSGVDTVIHLAAHTNTEWEGNLSTNVIGSYNVYEAAREAGVKRIVFGSSGATQYYYETEEPIRSMTEARWDDVPEPRPLLTHLSPVRPMGVYGAAKIWGEALGRYYSDAHGISVICLRIGRVVAEDQPRDARHAAVYCSHRDIVQIVERCVDAPASLRFDIFYAVSDNRGRFRDIEHARQVIGYEPLDGVRDWPLPAGARIHGSGA